ncbi:MAG: mandelate racemase/muconate lactonizing enzyme family protein [Chloroflexi bacterium]|nr:mandelate racemase/muconate lactonizing enzyme family protein [Chloroflexota bacterium]
MKITDVKAYVVEPALPAYGSSPQEDRQWTFVQIDTDEGISGFGECTNYPGGGSFLTARAVLACKEALLGEDPSDIERLWHKLYRRYTYLGAKGLPTSAISGVDIALWDIKGKALGRPVYDLLGGKFRDDVRLYANGWFVGCETPRDYAKAAKNVMLKAGHTACKLDPFLEMRPYHTRYVTGQISADGEQLGYDIVAAVREAVGPQHEILIDAHGHYNVGTAIRLANNLFEQSKIEWFEEPVPPESIDALRQVREHTKPRICVGERLFTRYEFVPILQGRLADYIMPDVVWTGGISELKKIATMAETYYVPISPHNAMGPLQVVAGAHVCMSVPNFYRLEHSMGAIPAYQKFLSEKLNFHDGCVTLNRKPGLGYDLDLDAIAAATSKPWAESGGSVPAKSRVTRRNRSPRPARAAGSRVRGTSR